MIRVIQLAKYTKGGLGDVREMELAEFDLYYAGMLRLNKLEEDEMKRRQARADAERG